MVVILLQTCRVLSLSGVCKLQFVYWCSVMADSFHNKHLQILLLTGRMSKDSRSLYIHVFGSQIHTIIEQVLA